MQQLTATNITVETNWKLPSIRPISTINANVPTMLPQCQ